MEHREGRERVPMSPECHAHFESFVIEPPIHQRQGHEAMVVVVVGEGMYP